MVKEIITTPDGEAPDMVEIYATGGKPTVVYFVTGWKDGKRSEAFFDLSGSRIPMARLSRGVTGNLAAPSGFVKALEYSRYLVRVLDHVRCDFLYVDSKVWFSEMTPYNYSDLGSFANRDEEMTVYEGWDLAQSWFLHTRNRGWKRRYADALLAIVE